MDTLNIAPRIREKWTLGRRLALILSFAALLGCVSCAPTAPAKTPTAPVAATPSPASAPATAPNTPKIAVEAPAITPRLAGEKTACVDIVLDLLGSLQKYEQGGSPRSQEIGFRLPQTCVNEYLAYSLRTHPRPGVAAVIVKFPDNNKISTTVEINFAVLTEWGFWTPPDLMRPLLRETRAVRVDSHFEVKDGKLRLIWDNALGPNGNSIPIGIVSGFVRAIGFLQPERFDADAPIPLPYGLSQVWTKDGLLAGETQR